MTEIGQLRSDRSRRAATWVVAAGLSVLWLSFIFHFGVDAPLDDDWAFVPVLHLAAHGSEPLHFLWAQHFGSRILIPNLVFVASATLDHANYRVVMLLSGVVWVVTYAMVLHLFARSSLRSVGPFDALLIGLVFFDLANAHDALWAFQIEFFLLPLFLIGMLWALSSESMDLWVRVGIAGILAILASLTAAPGLLLWPIGVIAAAWRSPHLERQRVALGIWVLAAVTTGAVFFWNFSFVHDQIGCPEGQSCSVGSALGHPAHLATYGLKLLGGIVPRSSDAGTWINLAVGVLVGLAGLAVVAASIVERRHVVRVPLALCLVVFGAGFDVMIAVTRVAVNQPELSEYVFPQVIVVMGIVVFVLGRIGQLWPAAEPSEHRAASPVTTPARIAWPVIAVLVVVLVAFGFSSGLSDARSLHSAQVNAASVMVNLDTASPPVRACLLANTFGAGFFVNNAVTDAYFTVYREDLAADHLAMFDPAVVRSFRHNGLPRGILALCTRQVAHA